MRRLVLLCLGTALLTSCVGPVRDFQGYRAKAWHSVETAGSAVETTRLAISDALRHHAFAASLSLTIRDAEEDASTAQSQFASIQPPGVGSDELRNRVSSLLSDASETVSRARIAIRRGDVGMLSRLRQPLDRLSRKLSDVGTRLQP